MQHHGGGVRAHIYVRRAIDRREQRGEELVARAELVDARVEIRSQCAPRLAPRGGPRPRVVYGWAERADFLRPIVIGIQVVEAEGPAAMLDSGPYLEVRSVKGRVFGADGSEHRCIRRCIPYRCIP